MADSTDSIKLLLNSLNNLPTCGYFEMIVECEGNEFGRTPKFCPNKDGSVELKFPVNIDVERSGLQWIINNPLTISLHQILGSTGRRKDKPKLIGKFTIDAFQAVYECTTNHFAFFKDQCLELDTSRNIQLEVSVIFEPKSGEASRLTYGWAKIKIEHLLNMPEVVVRNYKIVAAFRNDFSSDKEVVLCSISEAIKIEKLAINDGCMSERNGGNLRHREETASENKVELSNSSYLLKWDKEWRQVISSEDFEILKETISLSPFLPIEVFGCSLHNDSWCLSSLNESHGVAFVDLSQLLYPGVTRVRGAYEVKRFVDKLFEQKDTKGPSIAPDVVDMLRASNPSAKKDKAASTSKKETAKSSTADNISLEGINFDQHNASISVDIQLSKPLVPRRKEESAVLDVKDVLKRLEPAPTEPINTLNCIHALKNGVIKIFSDVFFHVRPPFERLSVVNECSSSFEFEPNERALEDIYLDFQSHLRFPIAADVRKCLSEITEPSLQGCIQNFLGDLKVHLMQEGRQLLRCVVEGEYEPRNMPSIGGLTQSDLRYFAEEAEVLGNLSWANFFIQNMLAEKPKSKEALIAASSFYARVGNREEAVVCLKWCLEITPNDVEVWWSLGTLLAEMGKFDEAKRLLEAAYEIASSDPTLWIVLGLFYESVCNTRNPERTFTMMDQLNYSMNITSGATKLDDQRDEGVMSEYTDCMNLINTIDRLLELKASTFVDRALARLLLHIKRYRCTLGDTKAENDFKLPDWIARSSKIYRDYMHDLSAYHRLLARHIMQSSDGTKRLLQAETHLKAALQAQPECADNWACLGSLYYLQMDKKRSIECLERAMQLETWPIQKPRLIQVQLAQCYAEIEDFEKSKLQYLQCCHQHPTSESWKGVGVACFRLNGLEEAEVAFQEANRLNNRDPVVWAYLAMLCLKANKRSQAELCIQSVQMLGLTDESIRKELDQVISNTESLSNDEN